MTDAATQRATEEVRSVPRNAEGPVFHEPWEAQAFALALSLNERGLFTWNEWAATLGDEIKKAQAAGDPDTGETYYHHWLATLERIVHDYANFNWIMTGTDTFAVEGTSAGVHQEGPWRAGVNHAGRWCDVFEIRDFLIQRCFIYLDPDYAGLDTVRYPWLSAGGRDPSKPMGSSV